MRWLLLVIACNYQDLGSPDGDETRCHCTLGACF